MAKALCFVLAMGLLGGFLPALRAARLGIVEALRASWPQEPAPAPPVATTPHGDAPAQCDTRHRGGDRGTAAV